MLFKSMIKHFYKTFAVECTGLLMKDVTSVCIIYISITNECAFYMHRRTLFCLSSASACVLLSSPLTISVALFVISWKSRLFRQLKDCIEQYKYQICDCTTIFDFAFEIVVFVIAIIVQTKTLCRCTRMYRHATR